MKKSTIFIFLCFAMNTAMANQYFNLNAGSIVDQEEAESKCVDKCELHGAKWTGRCRIELFPIFC